MIIDNYNMHNQTIIYRFWKFEYLLDFENEDIEDIEDDINDINDMTLSLIKKHAPDIYNTYEYDKYNNYFTTIYEQNLEVCADILHRRFNNRFFKHMNDLEADELSGAETETDE
jgi:hypothetical protein